MQPNSTTEESMSENPGFPQGYTKDQLVAALAHYKSIGKLLNEMIQAGSEFSNIDNPKLLDIVASFISDPRLKDCNIAAQQTIFASTLWYLVQSCLRSDSIKELEMVLYKIKNPGMTLRDWFAGMVLQGLFSIPRIDVGRTEDYSRAAYVYADLMLAEREKSNE